MFIGFAYGTANCPIAVRDSSAPRLLTLENGQRLLPSMIAAPTREAASEWLYRHHQVATPDAETTALQHYMVDPEKTWFVKSPKSFLGASGLKPQQIALFEDLVCAMMRHIHAQGEAQLDGTIDQAVSRRRAFCYVPRIAPASAT
ncbi:putative chaperone|nr:putative chaperone [Candidatus Pantoea persica]